MYFANTYISRLGPAQHDALIHGSNSNLTELLPLPRHDMMDHMTPSTSASNEWDLEDSRYEKPVDLVPDNKTGIFNHSCDSGSCKRVFINISGQLYETQVGTLNRFPNTLLGNPSKRIQYWDSDREFYYFSRHAPSFAYILYYYQSGGRLFCPEDVPEDVFLNEVEFYELGNSVISDFKLQNGHLPEQEIVVPQAVWRRKVWLLFEHPSSSMAARLMGLLSLLIILLSIANFCVESIPAFEHNLCLNVTVEQENSTVGSVGQWKETQNYQSPFFIIECICGVWFTIELLARFITSPYKMTFCKNIMNIFDIAAVVPFYIITLVVVLSSTCDNTKRSSISIVFLRVLRLFRSFRIFKLTKHSRGMQILGLTIKQSLRELSLFGIFLAIAVVFFSAAIYYADLFDTRSRNISSIPDGFWWAVVTMCTVGYGDKVPQGLLGKLVGSVCVVSGVITIALLVPVIVSNFSNYYGHDTPKTTKMIIVDSDGNRQIQILNTNRQAGDDTTPAANSTKPGCIVS